jgi:dUTP pyrophosphatase
MRENINEIKEKLKELKDLESLITGLDFNDPEKMLSELNIDSEEIEKFYQENAIIKVPLEYKNDSDNKNPEYAYGSDSGFDLRSTEEIWIQANDRKLIPTGLRFNIPENHEIQIRSKSGLALNQGLMVLNSPGTVDSGYQGEIKVILFNTTKDRIKIEKGQKIAQAVLCPVITGKWVDLIKVEEIGQKDRNSNGFGSTGL